MKKWLILLVTFMQLSSTTQFSQLYKLPVFFSHFLEHSNNTFTYQELETFIIHHYGGHEIDEDWETDQKLPFMNADRVHLDPCYVSNFQFLIGTNHSSNATSLHIICEDQILISTYLNTIWQPPKTA